MMNEIYNNLFLNILSIPNRIYNKLYVFWISKKKNITIEDKLKINGKPIIDIRQGCYLNIGRNVTLNSSNIGYHLNMYSGVKLFADRKNAKISIGNNTRIHGSCVHAYNSIEIGNNCLIAANCQIIDGNGHNTSFSNIENRINTIGTSKPITIMDNVWLATNVIVLPGVTIGEGSIISANSVVINNIPSMVLAGGNPAKVIKRYVAKETN